MLFTLVIVLSVGHCHVDVVFVLKLFQPLRSAQHTRHSLNHGGSVRKKINQCYIVIEISFSMQYLGDICQSFINSNEP